MMMGINPKKSILLTALIAIGLLLILTACGGSSEPVDTPVPTPTSFAGFSTPTPVEVESGSDSGGGEEGSLLDTVATRTPMPTATPGVVAQQVERIAVETGLEDETFLGLGVDDWINLGISVLLVALGYLAGTWIIRRVLPRAVKKTTIELDDRLLAASGPELRWIVVVVALFFGTTRLTFVSPWLKAGLADVYFLLILYFSLRITWHLVDLAYQEAERRASTADREDELLPLITLVMQLSRVVLVVIGISMALSRFGVDVTAFAAALGIGGLALSLAARDTIADAIAGFIILADRPFRVGDRIEIKGLGTWGDVVKIGLRTTSIRTRDNRMVIVPNSTIGKNEIINYTFPDPKYRIETHFGIGYGSDIEAVRKLMTDTVGQVEGVLPDQPVDVLYNEVGDSAMIFRVRWWIESYADTRRVIDRVHTALQIALDKAGVDLPFPTQTLKLELDTDIPSAFTGDEPPSEMQK
jgi:small-conductance mechanosensitive channel